MVSFKNLIRAVENCGIATSYVVLHWSSGKLTSEEFIQFLQSKVVALEYIEQASNFSPEAKKWLAELSKNKYSKRVHQR